MTPKRTLSKKYKWAAVIGATAMHPVLLYVLFLIVGERANLVIVIAPLLAAWLLSWPVAVVFAAMNAIVTALIFSQVTPEGAGDGLPKMIASILIISALSFAFDHLKRYVDKSRSLEDELEELRDPRRQ